MFCRNVSWAFFTSPSNLWVSFKQIENMMEIAKINEDTKAIALVSELIFADILNHRFNHTKENVLPKLLLRVLHYPKWCLSVFQPNPKYDWNFRNEWIHQGYSLGVWIDFSRYLKSSAHSYEAERLAETSSECCSLPQVMFEWVSTKSNIWWKLPKLVSELIFADILNHRLTHMNENLLPKLLLRVLNYPK